MHFMTSSTDPVIHWSDESPAERGEVMVEIQSKYEFVIMRKASEIDSLAFSG